MATCVSGVSVNLKKLADSDGKFTKGQLYPIIMVNYEPAKKGKTEKDDIDAETYYLVPDDDGVGQWLATDQIKIVVGDSGSPVAAAPAAEKADKKSKDKTEKADKKADKKSKGRKGRDADEEEEEGIDVSDDELAQLETELAEEEEGDSDEDDEDEEDEEEDDPPARGRGRGRR